MWGRISRSSVRSFSMVEVLEKAKKAREIEGWWGRSYIYELAGIIYGSFLSDLIHYGGLGVGGIVYGVNIHGDEARFWCR